MIRKVILAAFCLLAGTVQAQKSFTGTYFAKNISPDTSEILMQVFPDSFTLSIAVAHTGGAVHEGYCGSMKTEANTDTRDFIQTNAESGATKSIHLTKDKGTFVTFKSGKGQEWTGYFAKTKSGDYQLYFATDGDSGKLLTKKR